MLVGGPPVRVSNSSSSITFRGIAPPRFSAQELRTTTGCNARTAVHPPRPSRAPDCPVLRVGCMRCSGRASRGPASLRRPAARGEERLVDAVGESGTTLTELFGVGPYVAAIVIGYTGDVTRFANRDQFAAYTGTAPIEVSSGGRVVHRPSRRGNRQLNHAIHIAAITRIGFTPSPARAFYDRKIAEGKTKREAVLALKRRISDAVFRQLLHDATSTGPGGQTGTALQSSVTGIEPQQPALRRSHSRTRPNRRTRAATAATTSSASMTSRS